MIHVEQKKQTQKNGMRNLAKATNEIGIGIKTSNDTSKKTSDVKEKMTPYKKTKHTPYIVSFIMILYRFLWI